MAESELRFEFCWEIEQSQKFRESLHNLLVLSDEEFVPPLSSRDGTTHVFDTATADLVCPDGPRAYLENILRQKNIIILDGSTVAAFMSFISNHNVPPFSEILVDGESNNYVSTLIVKQEYRGLHIASRLYDYIEMDLSNGHESSCVSTRTWSTNDTHLKLLEKRGYTLIKRDEKNRPTGKGDGDFVDTVYYLKRIK